MSPGYWKHTPRASHGTRSCSRGAPKTMCKTIRVDLGLSVNRDGWRLAVMSVEVVPLALSTFILQTLTYLFGALGAHS